MTIYTPTDLYNKYLQDQVLKEMLSGGVSNENYRTILSAYPCRLYTPNYFIRIALGVLTIVASLFSGLLMGLLFESSGTNGVTALLFFYATATYLVLERLIAKKWYFNAGVDNLLLIISSLSFIAAFGINDHLSG